MSSSFTRNANSSGYPRVFVAILTALGIGFCVQVATAFEGVVFDYQDSLAYHSPEYPGYSAWCGLWKLPNGTIQTSFIQLTGKNPPVVSFPVIQSTNNGLAWSRVPNDVPTGYTRGMAVLSDGTMIRSAIEVADVYVDNAGHLGSPNYRGTCYSTDGGTTWTKSADLVPPNDYQLCVPVCIKPLRDGRLASLVGLCPSSVPPERMMANIEKNLFISTDQGKTWGAPIQVMPTSTGACEESDFVELPNGDLMVISRAQHYDANGVFQSENRLETLMTKAGATFTPGSSWSPFGGGGMPCDLMTQEGVILDFCSNGPAHWSSDNGQSWHDLLVNGQPLHSYDYPQAVQATDGTIVVVSHVGNDDVYGTVDQSIRVQTFRLTEAPEPSASALTAAGLLVVLGYRWHRCRPAAL